MSEMAKGPGRAMANAPKVARTRFDEIMAKVPMRRMGNPEEIADAVVWLLRKSVLHDGLSSQVVDGGYFAA